MWEGPDYVLNAAVDRRIGRTPFPRDALVRAFKKIRIDGLVAKKCPFSQNLRLRKRPIGAENSWVSEAAPKFWQVLQLVAVWMADDEIVDALNSVPPVNMNARREFWRTA